MEERGRRLMESLGLGHEESLVELSKYLEELAKMMEKEIGEDSKKIEEEMGLERRIYEISSMVFEKIQSKHPEGEIRRDVEELLERVEELSRARK
jgi:hypothetical protein